ncbi:MAG: heparan-alpha-glucosaminide N-acetyltransferase domain-containing protein [Methylococcales bacterium]
MAAKYRFVEYDILRGFAISVMLMANSSAYVLQITPPFYLRLPGSFAAPIFMMLAGMMLAFERQPKPSRGLSIIGAGCLIDVAVWQIIPFVTFDVLYVIGFGIVFTTFPARRLSVLWLWVGGLAFFVAGAALRDTLGYHQDVFEIPIPTDRHFADFATVYPRIFQQFLLDGWFPLLPWVGFLWLGAGLQRSLATHPRPPVRNANDRRTWMPPSWGLAWAVILVISARFWASTFTLPEPRMGYSELFYPPTLGYCLTAASVTAIAFFACQQAIRVQLVRNLLSPFSWMGQHSLLMYFVHLVVIRYLLSTHFTTDRLSGFFKIIVITWFGLVILAGILARFDRRKKASLGKAQAQKPD